MHESLKSESISEISERKRGSPAALLQNGSLSSIFLHLPMTARWNNTRPESDIRYQMGKLSALSEI